MFTVCSWFLDLSNIRTVSMSQNQIELSSPFNFLLRLIFHFLFFSNIFQRYFPMITNCVAPIQTASSSPLLYSVESFNMKDQTCQPFYSLSILFPIFPHFLSYFCSLFLLLSFSNIFCIQFLSLTFWIPSNTVSPPSKFFFHPLSYYLI